jgi:AcrR family transcriptional regulator
MVAAASLIQGSLHFRRPFPRPENHHRVSSSVETKTRLMESAGPIFASKGFSKATVREICDSAGVNLAAVSYHFGDKLHLYIATVEHARHWIHERTPDRPLDEDLPPETRLALLVRTMLTRFLGDDSGTWHLQLLNREILNPTAACEKLIEQHFRKRFEELMRLIDELGGPGLPQHDLERMAFTVMGQCFHYVIAQKFVGLMTRTSGTQEHYTVEELTEQITRFCLAGITHWESSRFPQNLAVPPADHTFKNTPFEEVSWPDKPDLPLESRKSFEQEF